MAATRPSAAEKIAVLRFRAVMLVHTSPLERNDVVEQRPEAAAHDSAADCDYGLHAVIDNPLGHVVADGVAGRIAQIIPVPQRFQVDDTTHLEVPVDQHREGNGAKDADNQPPKRLLEAEHAVDVVHNTSFGVADLGASSLAVSLNDVLRGVMAAIDCVTSALTIGFDNVLRGGLSRRLRDWDYRSHGFHYLPYQFLLLAVSVVVLLGRAAPNVLAVCVAWT